jgi:hypothetical protein
MAEVTWSPTDTMANGEVPTPGLHVRVIGGGYNYPGVVLGYYRNGGWWIKDDAHGCKCVHMAGDLHVEGE